MIKQRTPIRKVSKALAKKLRIYHARRKMYLEAHPNCEVFTCAAYSVDLHHKHGRGKYLLDESTWMGICRDHHEMVKADPIWARKYGYLV